MTPSEFKPKNPDDFIGIAKAIAQITMAKADRIRQSSSGNYRLLFHGAPGSGKSSLALALSGRLAGHSMAVEHLNGQSVDVQTVRDWRRNSCYRPLFGTRTVKVIDECDAMSMAAMNEYRTLSDTLPPCFDIILTTNRTLSALQPQLQSRTQQFLFKPCQPQELADWLAKRWDVPAAYALKIAVATQGDIRAALNEAETYLDRMALEVA